MTKDWGINEQAVSSQVMRTSNQASYLHTTYCEQSQWTDMDKRDKENLLVNNQERHKALGQNACGIFATMIGLSIKSGPSRHLVSQ